jgi:hypothetical protein
MAPLPPPNEANDELFFVEEERHVRADNTFSFQTIRFEALRHLPDRNLRLSALIEAVRDQTRTIDLKQVNRVLIQSNSTANRQNLQAGQPRRSRTMRACLFGDQRRRQCGKPLKNLRCQLGQKYARKKDRNS